MDKRFHALRRLDIKRVNFEVNSKCQKSYLLGDQALGSRINLKFHWEPGSLLWRQMRPMDVGIQKKFSGSSPSTDDGRDSGEEVPRRFRYAPWGNEVTWGRLHHCHSPDRGQLDEILPQDAINSHKELC